MVSTSAPLSVNPVEPAMSSLLICRVLVCGRIEVQVMMNCWGEWVVGGEALHNDDSFQILHNGDMEMGEVTISEVFLAIYPECNRMDLS